MKVIHTELKNYNRRADESVSFKLDSLLQLTSNDIAEVDSHRGDIAILVLTDSTVGNEIDVNLEEILENQPENDIYDNHKTPSQRLRGVLWHNCKQQLGRKPEDTEFADYYKTELEKLINHYKSKLDN